MEWCPWISRAPPRWRRCLVRPVRHQKTLNSHSAAQQNRTVASFLLSMVQFNANGGKEPTAFRRRIYVAFSNSQWSSRKLINICSAPAHMSISPFSYGLGHLENSTVSQPPTEIWTSLQLTRIKLLHVHFGLEVWRDTRAAVSWWRQTARLRRAGSWGQR